jgi:hypothetical protein
MRHPTLRRLLVAVLLGLAGPAAAVVVEGLHDVRITVPDQGAEARARAFRDALAEVLVRVTGDPMAPNAPDLAPLMRNPQRFLNRFSYAEEPLPDAPAGTPVPLVMLARFDPVALERAVREAGRAVWGRERPLILTWFAVDDGSARHLVADDASEAAEAARVTARRRGLALRFPGLDAHDREALTFADLWGGFEDRIQAAVAPYAADLSVVGGVTRAGAGWQGRWLLVQRDGRIERRASQGATLAAAVAGVFDGVATELAAEYAVQADPGQLAELELSVAGVSDVAAYARTVRHLEGLSLVRSVQVLRVAGEILTLRVVHAGAQRNLEQTIALGGVLAVDASASGILRYTYLP